MTEQEDREQEQAQLDEVRRTVGEAMGFLQGEAFSAHLESLTFPALLASAISVIEDDISDIRPGKLNGLRSLKERVQTMIAQARQMPGELFEVVQDEEEDEEGEA